MPRTYDPEFRRRVVELVRTGRPVRVIAAELEISEATYHRWLAQYGGLKADDVRRLKELEGENPS